MTTPVEALRKQFTEGGWGFVAALPAEKRSEALHIDFKLKKDASTGALHPNDIQNLSIALSGFANAEGGVLVWGVDARRDDDGVDQVTGVVPIKQLARLRSELENVTPGLVSGPVAGVEHIAIPTAAGQDEGVVLTVIPQSDLVPHMARGNGLHRYYKRTNTSFLIMEHYEVADQFGRRPQPVIAVRPFWELQGLDGGRFRFFVQFMVQNIGRGLARFPSLTIGKLPDDWPLQAATDVTTVGGPFRKVHAPFGWLLRYRGAADDVLHPGDRFTVAYLAFILTRADTRSDFRVAFEAIAEGSALVTGEFSLPYILLLTLMRQGGSYTPREHPDNDAQGV